MSSPINSVVIFGLPLAVYFGIITFICLLTTATIGMLVLKGLYHIPFKWHMRMAVITILFAISHVMLVISLFYF
jgi:hypothetical protein